MYVCVCVCVCVWIYSALTYGLLNSVACHWGRSLPHLLLSTPLLRLPMLVVLLALVLVLVLVPQMFSFHLFEQL